jgi:lysophospholipase L1-like esterase
MSRKTLLFALLLTAAGAAYAAGPHWVGSWGASPLPPSAAAGPFPGTPSFANQTIRQLVRLSVGGSGLRLRLSNEYGTRPLAIGGVRVAIAAADGTLRTGSERTVTFGGAKTATIPPGAPLVSDAVDLPVRSLDIVSVSLFLPEDTGPCTCHSTGMQDAYVSKPGDFTAGAFEPASTIQARAFLTGVDVDGGAAAHSIVVLGDSISDGIGSTPNANHRWPDLLADRLAARGGRGTWGVVNEGISGNRVLADGAGASALARFDRDVLAVPGVTHLIVFEGVNDLGIGYGKFEGPLAAAFSALPKGQATAEALIGGLRQIIARAHNHGIKVYGATITPYEGASYYSAEGNAVRERINDWIRKGGEFDGVLDFDAVLRDPADPLKIKDGWHAGDHLHGSDKGYRALADSIDLSLFR